MDNEELAKWMEAHNVGEILRVWISNELLGLRHYEVLEDLATTGRVTIEISLSERSGLTFQRVEMPIQKEPGLLSSIVKPRKVEK